MTKINEYYYDLSNNELMIYYNNLNFDGKDKNMFDHIQEVEKEIEIRNL